jgi:hypothetical protein
MSADFPANSLYFLNSFIKELEQFIKNNPDNKKWQHELSKCHLWIANIQFLHRQIKEGTNSFLAASTILEQLAKNEPGNITWQIELCRTYEMLGNFLIINNDLQFAELFYPWR